MSSETAAASANGSPQSDLALSVRRILATYRARPIDEVRLDSQLELDLEFDSFAMIEITIALEAEFGFSMQDVADPQDLNLVTVGDLVAYVGSRLAAQAGDEAGHVRSHAR
ncbi:MAG TPA: acyl carrier protein [Vicinamibacterales bacterium]|nr:acyl carrier protein [Vicinamibacterales bacterium]